tara:strand:- start:575 stop:1159 length:585 start_codon:yes stop_codon:yes gene_type:complete
MKKLILLLLFIPLVFSITSYSQLTFDSKKISDSAIEIIDPDIDYIFGWQKIPYPNGDVDPKTGVCTDVVIRAFRKLGFDLQKEIHIDMTNNFELYPKYWDDDKPDSNIDHRRVYNQMRYFKRMGNEIQITYNPQDYLPGDVVAWNLGGNTTHIGVVVDKKSEDGLRYMIIHNIGYGQVMEDVLFNYQIIGHYRF